MSRAGWPLAAALLAAACSDPVQSDAIDALGGEAPGVGPGPEHRPGQPCTLCHSEAGGRNPAFSVAGTVFRTRDGHDGADNVAISLIDSRGHRYGVQTNWVGNFYVLSGEYDPVFPIWATLPRSNGGEIAMQTPIFRERSCATCHADPRGAGTVGHLYAEPP